MALIRRAVSASAVRPATLCYAPERAMTWIISNIRWIMIVSGLLTATMVHAAIAPAAALQSTFGETLEGPLADIIVRNWGALIALVGVMLVYGAFDPSGRPLILLVAGTSKAIFITLVLSYGGRYLAYKAGIAVAIDSIMILLYAWYLLAARIQPKSSANLSKHAKVQ
jgi:hypothetical protein